MKLQVRSGRRGVTTALVLLAAIVAIFTAPLPARAASRYEPVTATVPVEVEVEGDKAPADQAFTVTMTAADGETVLPERDTVTVAGKGSATFELSYDEVGEHRYTVTQTTADADRWTLDRQTYDVTVYCMWEEQADSLFTKVIIKNADGYKDDACAFVNSYAAPEVPKPTEPSETAKPAKPSKGGIPQTGDTSLMSIAAAGVAGAVILAAGIVVLARRRRSSDN